MTFIMPSFATIKGATSGRKVGYIIHNIKKMEWEEEILDYNLKNKSLHFLMTVSTHEVQVCFV